ncbi:MULTISPECIES: HAD family hydrolase [unclassified Mitsuokella]|uniref:KdsC family phosphatase n=1 Tax=unclassified Mitsuokella TaxID=2637239 RepID=UPI000E486040|nr:MULTISPECIES: HAD hydrolase family protein [unclassified Mitsuokella]RGS73693.1 3-deoxy-D-manno-octulosonate 8-phosphate phosphatase [Mitsuokella sp. AF21-1AC]RHM55304.1 3-deoxy-D-manno-octulosonate 8-phosphate phosphatase [Mitsuokella sp. AF33-22]
MEFTAEAIRRAEKVRLIIFDVDGVLTDGGIYIGAEGELFKPFFCRDGLGVTMAHRSGLKTAIITGRQSRHLLYRAQELHITEVFQGNLDKRAAYRELKAKLGLADEEIAYFGDDLVDLAIMRQVGFPAAVGDAVPEVREAAVAVSGFPGGHGAVRELIEFILKAQGKWQALLDDFKALDEADGLAQ